LQACNVSQQSAGNANQDCEETMLKKFTLAAVTAATMFVGASAMTSSAEARPWHHRWHRVHMMHRWHHHGCGGMWVWRHHHRVWAPGCY
jgi:hypothetical protein